MSELMLIEAMKKLRTIEKRMAANSASIQRYASMVSNEKPYFETEDKQKKEIKQLIQSNQDLMGLYLDLKKRIEYTNLFTEVEIDGIKYPISDLLVIKRKMAQIMLNTFNSLNTIEGDSRRRTYPGQTDQSGKTPQVVRFYKEEDRIAGLKVWQDLYDNISSRLEVVNATTPLMSLPPVDAG
jgi:hypothetical protein